MSKNITIIIGGSGGSGRSVVRKFLTKNDEVIVLDKNEIIDSKILSNEKFHFIKVDVTNIDELIKAKESIEEKYGYANNVVSMAGINMKSEIGGMDTITFEDIDKSIKLNLNSHIYIVKIFKDMLKQSNQENKTITMISSINAITDHGLPAYSAAKAGLYGFMKSIAKELSQEKIRINTISLGTVPHNSDVIEGNTYFEEKLKDIAIKEFVKPTDVANTIYYLIYKMQGIIGQNIILDNGQSI